MSAIIIQICDSCGDPLKTRMILEIENKRYCSLKCGQNEHGRIAVELWEEKGREINARNSRRDSVLYLPLPKMVK